MKKQAKFALVRWGREKKHGQDRAIRLAKVNGYTEQAGLWCTTKPGHPTDLSIAFTTAENMYDYEMILASWTETPTAQQIQLELHRIEREACLRATRRYHKILEKAVSRHAR